MYNYSRFTMESREENSFQSRGIWNIERFNEINLPEIVGKVSIPEFKGIRVLDMPVKMAGSKDLRIPSFIKDFESIINSAINYEITHYGDILHYYVYITIDQKAVKAGCTGRRPGCHSDAFIFKGTEHLVDGITHTYIAYDNQPTEFFKAKFPIDGDCEESMRIF